MNEEILEIGTEELEEIQPAENKKKDIKNELIDWG